MNSNPQIVLFVKLVTVEEGLRLFYTLISIKISIDFR